MWTNVWYVLGKKSHTEYLVQYSDGTEKWERSVNVPDELIHVFNGIKVTNKGKPVEEVVPTEKESYHHVVKKILGHKRNDNQSFSYLVKWASRDMEDSWILEDAFDGPAMISEYWRSKHTKEHF